MRYDCLRQRGLARAERGNDRHRQPLALLPQINRVLAANAIKVRVQRVDRPEVTSCTLSAEVSDHC